MKPGAPDGGMNGCDAKGEGLTKDEEVTGMPSFCGGEEADTRAASRSSVGLRRNGFERLEPCPRAYPCSTLLSTESDPDSVLPNGTEIGLTNDDADGSAGTTRVGVSSDANQLRDGAA